MLLSYNAETLIYNPELNEFSVISMQDLYDETCYYNDIRIHSDKGFVRLEEIMVTGIKQAYEITTINNYNITISKDGYLLDAGFDPIKMNCIRLGTYVVVNNNKSFEKGHFTHTLDKINSIKNINHINTYAICISGINYITANGFLVPTMSIFKRDFYNLGILKIIEQ